MKPSCIHSRPHGSKWCSRRRRNQTLPNLFWNKCKLTWHGSFLFHSFDSSATTLYIYTHTASFFSFTNKSFAQNRSIEAQKWDVLFYPNPSWLRGATKAQFQKFLTPPSQEKVFGLDVRRLTAGISVREHQCPRPLTLRLCKQQLWVY